MAIAPADIVALSRLLDEAAALPPTQHEAWLAALPPEDQPHADRLRQMFAEQADLDRYGRLASLPQLDVDESTARPGERVAAAMPRQMHWQMTLLDIWPARR